MRWIQLLTVCVASTAAAQVAETPDFAKLETRWEQAMRDLDVPGFAVVVVRGDAVMYQKTIGVRDVGGKPVTPATAFYIASCTKSFVATAVTILAEEGKLSLDDPVKKHLPRFELADAELTERLTIRDLLCHSKGINSGPIVFLDAYTGEITEDRYYRFLKDVIPPGKPAYSNVHFTLAGRVLEAVGRKPWRDFLQERIFEPAGMRQATGYADAMYARDDVAFPMETADAKFARCSVRKTNRTMHAAGGLGTSILDLERWLRLNLNGGMVDGKRVVSEQSLAEIHKLQARLERPRGKIRRREGFGLGWFHGKYRGRPYLEHGGGYVGSAAHVSFLPEHNVGVACVANGAPGGQGLLALVSIDIYDRLLGLEPEDLLPMAKQQVSRFQKTQNARKPKGANPAQGGLSLDADAFRGDYVNDDWGAVRVRLDDGKLSISMGGLRAELYSSGKENRFVCRVGGALQGDGRFIVEDGKVVAVAIDLMGVNGVRFRRK